jgi:hypothetical protein
LHANESRNRRIHVVRSSRILARDDERAKVVLGYGANALGL